MMRGEVAMEAITTALVSGFTTGATDAMGAIASIVPVAIPVGVSIVVIRVGWRVFKMMTGR